MTDTRPEHHTAIHQAGHAVVAHVVELDFSHATLEPDADSLGHRLHHMPPEEAGGPEMLERLALVSLAGRAALEIHAGTVPDGVLDPSDRWMAAILAARRTTSQADARAFLDSLEERAREILTACWPAVSAVADALITRTRVTADEVRTFILSTSPAMAREVPRTSTSAAGPRLRRPTGASDSSDDADAIPEGALAGGVDEGEVD